MAKREAYVTLCTNDSYVPGALVVAHSLRMAGTTREIVCMTVASLPQHSRAQLATVFDALIDVAPLDTEDARSLALLGRPELGVTATKIACWTLTQFSKCVFLDADTVVLENVDDMFQRPEIAAAPDVGWPDCFNSGVFVFVPSLATHSGLLKTLASEGSFDGGDQGLLNTYFGGWSTSDPAHRLPFGYNMTANASYGYAPAMARFKSSVKIVHFIGETKPWMGAAASPWVDKWQAVYSNLSQHGSLMTQRAGDAGARDDGDLPSPAHWGDNSPPLERGGFGGGGGGFGGGGGGGGSSSGGSFSDVKQMLDAAMHEDEEAEGDDNEGSAPAIGSNQ